MRKDFDLCKWVVEWKFGLRQIGVRRGHLTRWRRLWEELICACWGVHINVGYVNFFQTIILEYNQIFRNIQIVRVQISNCLLKL